MTDKDGLVADRSNARITMSSHLWSSSSSADIWDAPSPRAPVDVADLSGAVKRPERHAERVLEESATYPPDVVGSAKKCPFCKG